MFANGISLLMYFKLGFTPKLRMVKNFTVSISGPLVDEKRLT